MEVATMKRAILLGLLGWLALTLASPLVAQPFTYQGFLKQNGQPVNGTTSLTFRLYDAPTGGTQIGSAITQNVNVQNGLFTVELNFGTVWTGGDRYLEIQVGSTTLSPRVKITPAPYASFAMRPWQTSGSSIFYNDGNVGIGTSSPAARLSLGGGDANTKLAIWQGANANDVMGFGVGPAQFRLHLHNSTDRFSFLNAPNGSEILTIQGNGDILLAYDRGIYWLDRLVGYNDLRLFGDSEGGPDLYIAYNGNVGIATTNPQARLHVLVNAFFTQENTTFHILPHFRFNEPRQNVVTLDISGDGLLCVDDGLSVTGDLHAGGNRFTLGGNTDPNHRRVEAVVVDGGNNRYTGVIRTHGTTGDDNVTISWPEFLTTPHYDHGAVFVRNQFGINKASMIVDGSNAGVITADIKSFRAPDPDDPTRDIWYGCIEGPELAMYVRGTARLVNGRARIELPDHFRKLADEQGMTVQLTPRSAESKGLAAVRVSLDGIEVAELLNGRGNYEFDWYVEAVRKEHRDFQVYRPWDEVLPGGTDPAEAWQARLQSIQERQARQQSRADTKGVQR
jgi:hypothetical protein